MAPSLLASALCRRSAQRLLKDLKNVSQLQRSLPCVSKAVLLHTSSSISCKREPPVIKPEEEKFIVRSPYTDCEIPEINLADFVWKDVHRWPDNVALVST